MVRRYDFKVLRVNPAVFAVLIQETEICQLRPGAIEVAEVDVRFIERINKREFVEPFWMRRRGASGRREPVVKKGQ